MADVTFDEEPQYTATRSYAPAAAGKQSSFSAFLIRMGIAKTQHAAEIVLLIIAGLAVVAAIVLFVRSSSTPKPPPPPPMVIHQQPQQ